MPDLWELPDAELWGQLDASLLEDEFRASEIGECLEAVRHAKGRPLLPSEVKELEGVVRFMIGMRQACIQFVRAVMEQQAAWYEALPSYFGPPVSPRERKKRTRRHGLTQPRTLHLALQANARPVLNRRAVRREWRKQGR